MAARRLAPVETQRALADAYGRVATDLRVSLTDRCNLRCSYCMPAEGLDWLPHAEVLSDDEVVRLIAIGVRRLGIREVRFTGGEPLIRRGLVDIVRRTRELGERARAVGHHQRPRARAHGDGSGGGRARPGQPQPRHPRRSCASRRSLAVIGSTTSCAAPRRPTRPGSPRSRSTPSCCAGSTTTRRETCSPGRSPTTTSCASSSRCRSMPSTTGTASRWSPPRRSSSGSPPTSR